MTLIRLMALTAAAASLTCAGAALAQDTPPPGCRWQGYQGETILACKDGKGNWLRSGDGMKVGTYPLAKPKPKPVAAASPPAVKTAEQAAAPAVAENEPVPADETAAPSVADAAVDAAAPAEPAAEPAPARSPWWKPIWEAILNFFRMIGLLK